MGTAVITCCNTPPVLQFAERIFNEMPTFIQRFVERKGCISGFPRRYADRHPPRFQRLPQPGHIIPSVCQKDAVFGKKVLENGRSLAIADLSFGQQKQNRPPMSVADRMEAELAKRNRPALPAAPRFDEAAMLELAAEIREAQQHYYRTFGHLCSRLISMSIPVFTALESRVYKQAPDRPFSGVRIGAQWERYFTERMTAALHSLDDRLPDEKNPAMLLLEYARAMSAR